MDRSGEAMRVVIDVSGIVRGSKPRPVGITRVELVTSLALAEFGSYPTEYVAFDRGSRRFHKVEEHELRSLANALTGARDIESEPPTATTPLPRRSPNEIRRGLSEIKRGAARVGRALRAATPSRRPATDDRRCHSSTWTDRTVVVKLGTDLHPDQIDRLADARERTGARIVLMVHDVMPTFAPQWFTLRRADDHFAAVVRTADAILVNSDRTAADLQVFTRARDLPQPPVVRLPLATDIADLDPVRPRRLPTLPNGFVLSVGTMTLRKNHHLLLDVWEMLLAERGEASVPTLLLVGAVGSLSTEVMSRIERTPEFERRVVHLADVSDPQLAWLYRNCRFTVFPSLYEGFGLPVTESHDVGRACIASNVASIPEAAEGLAVLLDRHDRMAWKAAIIEFLDEPKALASVESAIAENHRRISTKDSISAVSDAVVLATAGPV